MEPEDVGCVYELEVVNEMILQLLKSIEMRIYE